MQAIICDMFGDRIPIIKRELFGHTIEYVDRGTVKSEEWNCNKLFQTNDICKKCSQLISKTIDYELLKIKNSVT